MELNNYTILKKYSAKEITAEKANEMLESIGSELRVDENRNKIIDPKTEGLLDTGTGTVDKVTIKDGKITSCDCGEMIAYCYYNGEVYKVEGNVLMY